MLKVTLLLMTSRSGSSMVAEIFEQHGWKWASNPKKNPVVGRNVRYRSFENQVIKGYLKSEFGTPLGDMITFDDRHVAEFHALLNREFSGMLRWNVRHFWKGAVEFFPLWNGLAEDRLIQIEPIVVYRPLEKVIESVLAKRGGRGSLPEARAITEKRYDILHELMSESAYPAVMTDELVSGNLSSIEQAFAEYGHGFDPAVARAVIDPSKWETDR